MESWACKENKVNLWHLIYSAHLMLETFLLLLDGPVFYTTTGNSCVAFVERHMKAYKSRLNRGNMNDCFKMASSASFFFFISCQLSLQVFSAVHSRFSVKAASFFHPGEDRPRWRFSALCHALNWHTLAAGI